jgi:hypothetical protein
VQGPVVITASQAVWLQIRDGENLLKEGILEAGQSFTVPPTATAPRLTTAKAEALRISVGTTVAPAIGPAATKLRDVSLLGPDLLRGPAAPATAAPTTNRPAPAATRPTRPAPSRATRPANNSVAPTSPTNTQ